MPSKQQDVQEKIQLLRQQYADKLPDRITALKQDWLALNLDELQTGQYETLVREFHSLAGSGSSYGFPQITTLSREIENVLLKIKSADAQDLERLKTEINAKLASLAQAATEKPVN